MKKLFSRGGDSWVGAVAPDGRGVCFGGGGLPSTPPRVGAVDLDTGTVRDFGPGRNPRYLSPTTVTFQRELNPTHDRRMVADVLTGQVQETTEDPALVAGNEFDASGGHWGSRLDTTRRLSLDGRVLGHGYRGVRVSWPWTLSATFDDQQFHLWHTGQRVRLSTKPSRSNEWTLSTEGWIGYGYFWEARIIKLSREDLDVTVTPWRQESPPIILHLSDGVWIWTMTERPSDGQPLALGRPLGSSTCVQVPMPSLRLAVGYDLARSEFVLAGNTGTGGLEVWSVSKFEARKPVVDVVAPLGRPALIAPFFRTTNRYPEVVSDYPQNGDVVVEAEAVHRGQGRLILAPDALPGLDEPDRVEGLYVSAEVAEQDTAFHLDQAADDARQRWKNIFPGYPVPAVVGYVTAGMTARPGWPPQRVDVYAPELYFDALPTTDLLAAEAAVWDQVLPRDRQWLYVGQAYDRNGAQIAWIDALAAVTPAYLNLLRTRPWVEGILWFAVQRPGGVRDYPALLEAHRQIFGALPSGTPRLRVVEPDPGGDMIKVVIPVGGWDTEGTVGQPASILFQVESDSPVMEIEIDRSGDGRPGLFLREAEGKNLRVLRGVSIELEVAGEQSWHVGATNEAGESDRSVTRRPINVRPA